ncbi:type II secretion system protein [Patescibacteria group bacterium]|nr:type II secretion system protein [Patescibacteria group bacterium]
MKSFTLIEVLVVVTIIALLISINLVAIGHYQDKARDTAIAAGLSQVRKVAAMIYTDENSYEFICAADNTLNDSYPALKMIEDDVNKFTGENPTCYSERTAYCVQSSLLSAGGGYFCIDSTGFADKIDGDYCTGTSKNCSP